MRAACATAQGVWSPFGPRANWRSNDGGIDCSYRVGKIRESQQPSLGDITPWPSPQSISSFRKPSRVF